MIAASFEAILERLAKGEVDFIVVGGLAAALHGSAYVTRDIDVCYGRSQASIEHLCRALADLHPALRGAPEGLPFRFDAAGRPKDLLIVPELEALQEMSKKA